MDNFPKGYFKIPFITIFYFCFSCGNPDPVIQSSMNENGEVRILIEKSSHKLTLFKGGKIIKNYSVVFGFNPVDDKRKEGDGCTPEGVFRIRDKYPHKKWNFFIWIDYPTEESWRKHKHSMAAGEIPAGSRIGGEIGIHGVPEGKDAWIDSATNWTLGCISLQNKDIEEIYSAVNKGDPVEIRP